ncbi:hypothetical protein [Natrinema altunense]|uniref:Uncharacterized protein n=1 Tax=Natrinema altunense (strain JCM 12890 / CGMCC 1.3731 / AJ2) TaxID=1227494 RepID=L9ZAW7_NATA2|nr:hypothetical protein [Natrinema altunense]ELY83620.1 hypothetical protein C485_17747 [Natrinema altunense JCM 12890]
MTEESDWVYPTELEYGSNKVGVQASGDYLGVPLSDDLEETGFLQEGEDGWEGRVELSIESEWYGGEEARFILMKPTEENSRYSYKIRTRPTREAKYLVRIPPEWYEHNMANPFYGLEKGDRVTVVVERGEDPAIKVYQMEDYQLRLDAGNVDVDIRLPSVAAGFPLGEALGDGLGDLTVYAYETAENASGAYTVDGVSITVEGLETGYEKTKKTESNYAIFSNFMFGQRARITAEEMDGNRSDSIEERITSGGIFLDNMS